MPGKPEFFWSPPDGAPIVGMTQYRDFIVVATASGIYTVREDGAIGLDRHVVEKVTFTPPEEPRPPTKYRMDGSADWQS